MNKTQASTLAKFYDPKSARFALRYLHVQAGRVWASDGKIAGSFLTDAKDGAYSVAEIGKNEFRLVPVDLEGVQHPQFAPLIAGRMESFQDFNATPSEFPKKEGQRTSEILARLARLGVTFSYTTLSTLPAVELAFRLGTGPDSPLVVSEGADFLAILMPLTAKRMEDADLCQTLFQRHKESQKAAQAA